MGQRALIRRTYYQFDGKRDGTWPLSFNTEDQSLRNALVFINLVLWSEPVRIMLLSPSARKPLLIASDAQASELSVSAAYLAVDPEDGTRWGAYWSFAGKDLESLGVRRLSYGWRDTQSHWRCWGRSGGEHIL